MYSLDIRVCTSQLIHCLTQVPNRAGRFFITFVYGFNEEMTRERLLQDIQGLALHIDDPWMVVGENPLSLMDRILCWNVRGINSQHKHREIKQLINSKRVRLVSLLETKVKNKNMGSLYSSLFSSWCFNKNNPWIDKGRIIVAWNPSMYSLDIRVCTSQLIHCLTQVPNRAGRFFITFVYGFNEEMTRERLLQDIQGLALHIDDPWMVVGDFNEILYQHERIGCFHTWNNKHRVEEQVYAKIHRALVNSKWTDTFQNSEVVFLLEGIFDHSPILVSFYFEVNLGKKPFMYFQMWKEASSYEVKVSTSWTALVMGTEMFKLITKYKRLKQVFLDINREGFHNIQQAEFQAKLHLMETQEVLHKDPLNDTLIKKEQLARDKFVHLHKAYILFLAQKAKETWVHNGDENSYIFHASLKIRRLQNIILSIKSENGIWVDTLDGVKDAFLGYYQRLLGTTTQHRRKVSQTIMNLGPVISKVHSWILSAELTSQEVKEAILSISGMKAPGPDGFSSFFYQDN
ncbi:uncharacterized protein LOC133799992 [Humulus lupulus]|uniref:uncharacterized protein LOC133799992 n=1 Tax=Humulus lupulus TaxID=3486 RepID=UPI002B40B98B|nr:uncharacterized protein LOC133799992 [Humulus lupulus]